MSKARPPASQPTPHWPAASPEPSSHSTLRIEPSAATTTSTSSVVPSDSVALPHVSVRVALERRHRDAGAQVHAVVALHLRGDPPDHPAERADQRRLAALGDGHGEVELAADRGHLRADEPGADDQDPPGPGRQRAPAARPRRRACGCVNTPSSAASVGLNQGRARTPVAISRRSYRTCSPSARQHLPGGPIQSGRRHPEPPLGVDRPQARQRGVVGRHPALAAPASRAAGGRTARTARPR